MTHFYLHIGPQHTSLAQPPAEAAHQAGSMPLGWQSVLTAGSQQHLPTPADLEMAIMQVEDAISASWPQRLTLDTAYSSDAELRQLATRCGLADTAGSRLERQQVETLFSRLANAVEGASATGLPASGDFIGSLLILRELMHHLDIRSITLASPTA